MSEISLMNNRKPSTVKRILTIILLILQIIDVIFRISQTLAKEFGLPYIETIYYILLVITTLLVAFFLLSYKKWWIPTAYISLVLSFTIAIGPIKNRIEDKQKRFTKNDQNIRVIVPEFQSFIPKDGADFSQRLYQQLGYRINNLLTIEVGDTTLSVNIETQKVNDVWDEEQIKIRGNRRKADLGIIGNYRHYLEKGERKEIISDFKVIILDTLIANIFKEEKPFGDIYEFIVNIEDISVPQPDSFRVEEKAVIPIEYIIKTAGTTKLLQHAININRWNRNQTLSTINLYFSEMGKLIKNRSLACFHQGNSFVRAALNQKLSLDKQRDLFKEATIAYKKSIDSLSSVQQKIPLKLNHPERAYLNLAWTYLQLDSLTGDSAFKDNAEAVYDSAVAKYPNRETLEEQHAFLAHRCEEEFIAKKDTSRIEHAEQLYNKYTACTDKFAIEIRTKSRHPSKRDQEILDKIKDNKEFFDAHLKKLRELQKNP